MEERSLGQIFYNLFLQGIGKRLIGSWGIGVPWADLPDWRRELFEEQARKVAIGYFPVYLEVPGGIVSRETKSG